MFAHTNRRSSYKTPPTAITDRLLSQEARRAKALEDQKRRRAQRVDAARHLDSFADLSLGASDDEHDGGDEDPDEPLVVQEGVAAYAAALVPNGSPSVSDASRHTRNHAEVDLQADAGGREAEHEMDECPRARKKQRGKGKRRRARATPNSKWADRCMYAELLEMHEEHPSWSEDCHGVGMGAGMGVGIGGGGDGLPADLEHDWVAVAPVPVGKRCLAITYQSAAGVIGISPNTTLRSRLLGKMLLPRFPSSLPPLTVLDCILDENWRANGLVHVLDVITWKGQHVADCETPFRFWWRDTRLAELPRFAPPPTAGFQFQFSLATMSDGGVSTAAAAATAPSTPSAGGAAGTYTFSYPVSFVPVPYHTDTTAAALCTTIIPAARAPRMISVVVPGPVVLPSAPYAMSVVDAATCVEVHSDGLLLYVAQAAYESGTSPLACWVPRTNLLDAFERLVRRRLARQMDEVGSRDGIGMEM